MIKPMVAKRKGWAKIVVAKKITEDVGAVRSVHDLARKGLEDGKLADALDFSLRATLDLQRAKKNFVAMRLGKYGHDLRALMVKIEEEDAALWPEVLRTTRETLTPF